MKEALKQAEAAMIATTSPAAYLLALGAKILSLMQCGRFGEVLRIVGTGRNSPRKMAKIRGSSFFAEAWLRSLCFDFEGVLRLSRTAMRSDAKQHAVPWTAIGMISGRLCGTLSGEIRRGIAVLRASTRPWDNAQFLSTLVLANAGPAWFE